MNIGFSYNKNLFLFIIIIMQRDIRNVDLNLLKALDALIEAGSVTGAAKQLSLTQPAVSGMLLRLRKHFNDPLFVRGQHGMIPTARTHELIQSIKRILNEVNALLAPSEFNPSEAKLTLKIAATDYTAKAILIPFIADLQHTAPHIKIVIMPLNHNTVNQELESGLIDLALITPEVAHKNLHATHLYDEHYVCLCRNQHPLAKKGAMTIDAFCEAKHALVSYDGDAFYGITDRCLEKIQRKRNVVVSIHNFLLLPEILACTDLIAVVPSLLSRNLNNITIIEPPIRIPGFTKLLTWHEKNHHDLAHQWLRDQIIQLVRTRCHELCRH